MPREPRRVYPAKEQAHLWASYNRGDTTLDHARTGREHEGARFTGNVFYSEGDVSAVQRTAKNGTRYVLAVPGRKWGVHNAVGPKNGRYIMLPSGAFYRYRWQRVSAEGGFSLCENDLTRPDCDMATVVRAMIEHGTTVRYLSEARWIAKVERLPFAALLKQVLDADDVHAAEAIKRQHDAAEKRAERIAEQAREAAERAANDKNPLVRALRGVGAAAWSMHNDGLNTIHRVLGWTADLAWLVDGVHRRPYRPDYGRAPEPTLLRVSMFAPRFGAETARMTIVTNRGASFPAEHGMAAWPFILRAWERRETWEPKATTGAVLGHYRIDRVDAEGTVHAGCHHVPFWSVAFAHYMLEPGATPVGAMRQACELVQSRDDVS